MLDAALFREVKDEPLAGRQAFISVFLGGLGIGVGIGLVGFFRMAGALSVFGLLIGIIVSLLLWLLMSFCAWLIGKTAFRADSRPKLGEIIRTLGFAASPGIMGIFAFTPLVGGYILAIVIIWVIIACIAALTQGFNTGFGRAAAIWTACSTAGAAALIVIIIGSVKMEGFNWDFKNDFDRRLNYIVAPYRFSIISWELENIPSIFKKGAKYPGNALLTMEQFFYNGQRAQSAQEEVGQILETQIRTMLAAENITSFPPLNLRFTQMPKLLVISPRDKIESVREILLDPLLSLQQIQDLEKSADSLNVSALVVDLGGFAGTYPTLVSKDSSLGFAIDAALEEWLHQYLALRPLGFRYILDLTGIKRDYEIATINEAAAGMISAEIGAKLKSRFYPDYEEPVYKASSDFNLQMREIRLKVDEYLSQGQIEAAEQYMEKKRQELAEEGYYIRKLNQAYFAWHGTYANQPTSVSPIGAQLRQLRSQYTSVKQFLDIVSKITSGQDLIDNVSGKIKFVD